MKPHKFRIILYTDSKGEWRWSLRAGNGERVADSSEGYTTKTKCRNMVKKIAKLFATATLEVQKSL
jgi:uncharacterized protein YegP (UPF0339 family)